MIRVCACIALGFIALFAHETFFVLAALVYVYFFRGYELFIIALCIDALFGKPTYAFPYVYTTTVFILYGTMALLRPHLRSK